MVVASGVLSGSAASARARRASSCPPAHLQPRPRPAVIVRAEGVRLRTRLEEKGGHALLAVGVEHRLVDEVVVSCAQREKTKAAK